MKREVDLTLNRKFSSNNFKLSSLRSVLHKRFTGVDYPWVMNVSSIISTLRNKEELLATGNKKERARKKREIDYYENTECDCCGEKLNKKPWKRGPYRLCGRCDINLGAEPKRTFWIDKFKMSKAKKVKEN